MLKKIFSFFVIASAVLFLCAGCRREGQNARTFIVGFDPDFAPFGYMENGSYKGFDLELAAEVCKRNGWKFVPRPIEWSAKDLELESGSIDCIWNGFSINGREDAYEWSEPYMDNSQVVLVKAFSGIQNLNDLAGKRVAIQTNTPIEQALHRGGQKASLGATFKKLISYPDYGKAVQAMEANLVDAVIMDVSAAREKLLENPDYLILDECVMQEKYGIGFKKGNTELRDKVVSTLKEMVADGTAVEISEKYFDGINMINLDADTD